MAAMLKNAAAAGVNKGQPSSFYTGVSASDKTNPVIQALEQDIKLYTAYMKKRSSPGYKPQREEAKSRFSDALFELWNKYEPRLPKLLYQRKLLEMGDFLTTINEYNLALWQCYGRYLKSFGDVNVEEIVDVNDFKQVFFPDGFDTEDAGFTFRALMGKSICHYQALKQTDPKLQNRESVDKCVQLLAFLRLVTQVILPKESLCWLVYNGTIHIYSISRHLMSLGHSSRVLEFLLWTCMSMESSIPLLGVKYLIWRSTLYTAVCQCYYDCKAGHHAEAFARRALSKLNELSQLENLSSSPDNRETEHTFRHATIKMACMVYKRTVFETRRKPKGLLRPKTRANLKDAAQLPWPRTASERLIADMFEGSATQMLAIIEALTDSNRRTLISSQAAGDSEVEMLDVFAELFLAGAEIIAGGGGHHPRDPPPKGQVDLKAFLGFNGVVKERSLMDMAVKGEDSVPLSAVVKFTKLSYCYEQWDTLDAMLQPTINALKETNDPHYGPDIQALELLQAFDRVVPRTKHRRLFQSADEEEDALPVDASINMPAQNTQRSNVNEDHLIQLAEVLLGHVHGAFPREAVDIDMVVDAVLLLWTKCKAVFQRYQTGSTDNPRYLQRMDNPSKWVYVLDIVHQVLGWCGLSSVDPALTAEVVLRLALVYEASAALDTSKDKNKSAKSGVASTIKSQDFEEESSERGSVMKELKRVDSQGSELSREPSFAGQGSGPNTPGAALAGMSGVSLLGCSPRDQLIQARDILEQGLVYVSMARQAVALTDGKSIADIGWVKELNEELFKPLSSIEETLSSAREDTMDAQERLHEDGTSDAAAVLNMVKDLHLELICMYHRVGLKLAMIATDISKLQQGTKRNAPLIQFGGSGRTEAGAVETYEELVSLCRRNNLSRALLYMQRAVMLSSTQASLSNEQRKLLEDALMLIKKAEVEENRLFTENIITTDSSNAVLKTKVPPAPRLLCRTDVTAVLRPSEFVPASGENVAWYRIFARNASGSNVKVRLNDYNLPGTGEEVPSFRCELKVSGLTPGERYVYAVAAYTSEGKLIGGAIGDSTRPILASHPLPILMTWAYLSQVAYQVGCYGIAKESCSILWSHFVAKPPPPENVTYTTSAERDFKLTLHKLNPRVVMQASPVLLRMFLTSIFISADIKVKEGQLFCDRLCDQGPLQKGQLSRLLQCEALLVGLQLAGWLNEANLALQAVVQCYGLLAPLIHFKIPAVPIIQVLERCNAVLQEIPPSLRQKRPPHISESLHHMTACLTYHMAKVLRTWGQRSLASAINDTGRRLLSLASDHDNGGRDLDPGLGDPTTETGSLTLAALKKKKTPRRALPSGKEDSEKMGNEELKALEAHILRLSKQAQGEHELTGNEDPSILHAYIAYLPSRIAQKEVSKFRRRARYLEFMVQVVQKALAEGIPDMALEWSDETCLWLQKRNEMIIGSKATVGKQPGAVTIIGDDQKRFQAALVEYSKTVKDIGKRGRRSASKRDSTQESHDTASENEDASDDKSVDMDNSPRTMEAKKKAIAARSKGKKSKYKAIGFTTNMTEAQRAEQERLEIKALDVLKLYFIDSYNAKNRRRKLRKVSSDEMPWRSQFNIVAGLSQFAVFLSRLDNREKMTGAAFQYMYRSSYLDEEWFTFETSGSLVVGWNGGPSRQHTRQGGDRPPRDGAPNGPKASGIEMAAAAATGKPAVPLHPLPQEEEDTPRTYRSDADPKPTPRVKPRKGKGQDVDEESVLLSKEDAIDMLKKSFAYLRRAVILAHRGQHWTLLQNACRAMWNIATTAMSRAHSPDAGGENFLEVAALRQLTWQPFHVAADCLLDMLIQLQHQQDGRTSATKDLEANTNVVKSWTAGIKDEKGGASLKFESPLDDLSTVDMRWVMRIVMRTLEMLYYEQKWERLADIALCFNAISDDRYAEQVAPLLVQAQRKLISRVTQYDGKLPPQPHFQAALEGQGGRPMGAKDYVTTQLRIRVKDEELSRVGPGTLIDPEGHDAYSGGLHAMRQCCVPLDVGSTLQQLREALDKSSYTARGLRHARKLLILYLAGQMNNNDEAVRLPSRSIDFKPTTAAPQPSMPPDLTHEEFLAMDDIQTSPLPQSQVTSVMAAYDKTIELLLAGQQRGLAAEAMKELGNLHYHMGNIKGAFKWWSESLDVLLNTRDAIHAWRRLFEKTTDLSQSLLDTCGLWGCVLGGIICSNIAQYILTGDLGLRSDCCFLSGCFFKALFRSSLPHPCSDRDYALYEVGEGCEVTNLLPGVDLLSERFRCDGRTLVAAIRFVMDELARGRHNLFVLPLLTLYQFFTTFVCRDLQRAVDGRILKVRILTDLGLFSEAFITLQRLLNGERLPYSGDSNFRQVEGKLSQGKFDTSKPIVEPPNLKVLEAVIDKRVSASLATLYGANLTCQLSVAQAHLLVAIADTIPVLPKNDDTGPPGGGTLATAPTGKPDKKGSKGLPTGGVKSKKAEAFKVDDILAEGKQSKSTASTSHASDGKPSKSKHASHSGEDSKSLAMTEGQSSAYTNQARRFTSRDKPVTVEVIKGVLLATGEQILSTLADIIMDKAAQNDKGVSGMNAAELELVVQSRLELAGIACQRHHSAMAARIMNAVMRLIQGANIFREKRDNATHLRRTTSMRRERSSQAPRDASPVKLTDPDQESSQHQYQNFQSRSRLDARLWLTCRLALVKSMVGEVKGMGQVKGPEKKVKAELADVRQYCAKGVAEAEACGDTEMHAEFLLQAVTLDTMEGRPVGETKELLEEVLHLLSEVAQLSQPGQLLRTLAVIHLADLQSVIPAEENQPATTVKDTLDQYCDAQGLLLTQLEEMGEKIEHRYDGRVEYSTPVSPIQNLYLPHLYYLVLVKMRIGHSMAQQTARLVKEKSQEGAAQLWAGPLGVLGTALEMCKVIAGRIAATEAELLLSLGKVQRQLFHLGHYHPRAVADTLLTAIKVSYANNHDLSLMRQAYLELAVVYLASSGLLMMRDGGVLEAIPDSEDEISLASKESVGKARRTRAKKLGSLSTQSMTSIAESEASSSSHKSTTTEDMGQQRSNNQEQIDNICNTSGDESDHGLGPMRKEKSKEKLKLPEDEKDREKYAALVAIRCAMAIGQAQRKRVLLVGDPKISAGKIGESATPDLPEFLILDLISNYVLGERKRIYKNEIEEELAPLTDALEPPPVETYDDQINKARDACSELSWIHIMGYQSVLLRLCSTSSLATGHTSQESATPSDGDLGPEFDLGFISHAQLDMSADSDTAAVRSILFCAPWELRLNYLHQYLCDQLPMYASECTAVYPPVTVQLSIPADVITVTDIQPIVKSYAANMSIPIDIQSDGTPIELPVAPGTQDKPFKRPDKFVLAPTDNEMCLQWYEPTLDHHYVVPPITATAGDDEEEEMMSPRKPEKQVMLLYAMFTKKQDRQSCGMMWVSLPQLIDLHDRLMVLTQRGEISLADKVKKEVKEVKESTAKTSKKQARIKALSPKLKRDEHLEALLRQCMADAQRLLGYLPDTQEDRPEETGTAVKETPTGRDLTSREKSKIEADTQSEEEQQIPFDVSRTNMHQFEQLFDPRYGHSLGDLKMFRWFLQCF